MAKKVKVAGFDASDLVGVATSNPYIHRVLEDSSIRDNFQEALESGRSAIDRLGSAKNPAKALLSDKRVQADLRTAIESLRDATTALTDPPKKKAKQAKKRGRKLLLVSVGAGAALAGSEGLRTKVLDALFGAEEEFQYTPPAGTPATPPPAPVSAA